MFFGGVSANWAVGVFVLIIFLLQWGYFTLFEAFDFGRTPGKRVARIRVIHQSGRGVNFVESLARNLVRFVDYLPGFYAVGVVSIFVSKRNQRLGDMVAGTLVVRDREARRAALGGQRARSQLAPLRAVDSPAGVRRQFLPGVRLRTCASRCLRLLWQSFRRPISKCWKDSLRAGSTWIWRPGPRWPTAWHRHYAPSPGSQFPRIQVSRPSLKPSRTRSAS